MKVIVTGATGFVGSRVLRYCISNPEVTSIVVLSRHDIEKELSEDSKVTTIVHDDFEIYSSDLLKKLEGAVACLWCLGLKGAPLGYNDLSHAEKVDVTYPVAAADAFMQDLAPHTPSGVPFRFVLCSGRGAEMDQTKSFYILHQTKLLKGRVEKKLYSMAEGKKSFEVYTCRPLGIMEENPPFAKALIFKIMPSVKAVELAAVMLDLGLRGSTEWIWENEQIGSRGSMLLSAQS